MASLFKAVVGEPYSKRTKFFIMFLSIQHPNVDRKSWAQTMCVPSLGKHGRGMLCSLLFVRLAYFSIGTCGSKENNKLLFSDSPFSIVITSFSGNTTILDKKQYLLEAKQTEKRIVFN